MDAPREMTLTLPPDVAQFVRAEMEEGGYHDEIEVIRDSLAALGERDLAVDAWLDGPVRETYEQWAAGTLETVSMEEVRARFEAECAKRLG